MDKKTIPLSDVYIAFCSSKPTLYKAITGLILTSTMTPTTLSKLTLEDFLISCNNYFDKNEEKTLQNLLKKDPEKIIPCWKLESEGIITFNTPEVTFYIFLYLKEKRIEDLDKLSQPLFKTKQNNFLTPSKISSHVTEFNPIVKTFNNNHNQFKSKNLINTFKHIYEDHMNIEINNKKNLIKLFEGKLSKNSKFYRNSLNDNLKIKNYYKMLVPFLTARNCNFNEYLTSYTAYFKSNNNNIIEDYYYTKLKEKLCLEYGQEQLLLNFAGEITKKDVFLNTESYLNKLFKKSVIRLKIYNHNFKEDIISFYGYYIEKNHSPEKYASKIEQTITDLKVKNIIKTNEYELYRLIIEYIVRNRYYNKNIRPYEAKRIIEEILFDIIDNE